jgi:hypothetical protein
LRGLFDGPVTITFGRAEDGLAAELPVNIPAAGTLTLTDVRIDWGGRVSAANQGVDFEAILLGIDCDAARLTVASARRSSGDTDTYVVSLRDSSLHDGRGNPLSCGDLRSADRLECHGIITDDGTFGRADILRRD